MTRNEAERVVAYMSDVCPERALSDATRAAWAELLLELDYQEAMAAARHIATKQIAMHPADVHHRIGLVRAAERYVEKGYEMTADQLEAIVNTGPRG